MLCCAREWLYTVTVLLQWLSFTMQPWWANIWNYRSLHQLASVLHLPSSLESVIHDPMDIARLFRDNSAADSSRSHHRTLLAFSAVHKGIHGTRASVTPPIAIFKSSHNLRWKSSARAADWNHLFKAYGYQTVCLWCFILGFGGGVVLSEASTCN